jgi:hypothetical protein
MIKKTLPVYKINLIFNKSKRENFKVNGYFVTDPKKQLTCTNVITQSLYNFIDNFYTNSILDYNDFNKTVHLWFAVPSSYDRSKLITVQDWFEIVPDCAYSGHQFIAVSQKSHILELFNQNRIAFDIKNIEENIITKYSNFAKILNGTPEPVLTLTDM